MASWYMGVVFSKTFWGPPTRWLSFWYSFRAETNRYQKRENATRVDHVLLCLPWRSAPGEPSFELLKGFHHNWLRMLPGPVPLA